MSIPSSPINILLFPQRWFSAEKRLTLKILLLPKGDPLAGFAPAFPDATLSFTAGIIPSLDQLPALVPAGPVLPIVQDPVERRQFFDALVATFDQPDDSGFKVKAHAAGPPPPSPKPGAVKKYLTGTYREAARFSSPRTRFALTNGAYDCALHDGESKPPDGTKPSREFYWEEILSFLLRQPLLAEKLGLIYKTEISFPDPDPNPFENGGYLYADLAVPGDYTAMARQCFAARIPPLKAQDRAVFAAVLFPLGQPGNYDQVFPEAELYDDGIAKLVHGTQPHRAAMLETSTSTLPAPKDTGIRLAWDDEQVAIWLNRQLGINAVDAFLPPPPTPLGVGGYRVDVFDTVLNQWQSLLSVEADLKLGDLDLGRFDDELSVEVLPVNSDNNPAGEFWLPSYFTAWAGGSLAVADRTAFELAGQPDTPGPRIYAPVGADAVPLLYGNDYRFRVRLMDLTGGGPTSSDPALHPGPAPETTIRFRRYVAPKMVSLLPGGGVADDLRSASYQVVRPTISYPDVVFTGKYADAVALLQAQSAPALADEREPSLPDPDVTQLRIEVQVRTLTNDPAATAASGQSFMPLYTAVRGFPAEFDQPLALDFEFQNLHNLTTLENADIPEPAPLPLPTARAIRLVLTPMGIDDPDHKYWGSGEARVGGAPLTVYLQAPSSDERNLFQPPATPQIQAIFLQPDPPPDINRAYQLAAAGLRHEAPSDLVDRLAHHVNVTRNAMTLSSQTGRRTVFGCSNALRHTLNPDASSITFGSKSDLTRHWIAVIDVTLDRDWSWYAPGHFASLVVNGVMPRDPVLFEIHRHEKGGAPALVGRITMPGALNPLAAQNPDRNHTRILFFDAYDPKPAPGMPLEEPELTYRVTPVFRDDIPQVDEPLEWTLRLPITTPPAQTPRLVSAGFAFSPYRRDELYSTTEERRRMLFFELDAPPADGKDRYFARVLAYGPDPMLLDSGTQIPSPDEPPLPIDPEFIRVVTPGQSADCAGITAMQELIASPHSDRHYLLPLPPDLSPESPELLGFFVYELRVGHDCSRWSTANGRFGLPLRVAGVQHPAPQLRCDVTRSFTSITVKAPFASPIWEGRNFRPPHQPNTRLQALLYAQVRQVDGQSWRNVLLMSAMGSIDFNFNDIGPREDIRRALALMQFPQDDILNRLSILGLPPDSSLSVIAAELLPEPGSPFDDPLGVNLGQVRILRTTPLTAVPAICPPL